MHKECSKSLESPPDIVSSDLDVEILTEHNTCRVSTLSVTSDGGCKELPLNLEAFGPAELIVNNNDTQVCAVRLTNTSKHPWRQRVLKHCHTHQFAPYSTTVEPDPASRGIESPASCSKEEDYNGALQINLFPHNAAPTQSLDQSTNLSERLKSSKLSLDLIISSTPFERKSGIGGTTDLSLFGTNSSSPAKRVVHFNSCVSRGVFEKELGDLDSENGSEQRANTMPNAAATPIERLPPAMILPHPDAQERGKKFLFVPPAHVEALTEDDLVVYGRHPEGIRGIRTRNHLPPLRTLKRGNDLRGSLKAKYEVITKDEVEDLDARRGNVEVHVSGDKAGVNGASNSSGSFLCGWKAKRNAPDAMTSIPRMNLKDLEWVQVEDAKELSSTHVPAEVTMSEDLEKSKNGKSMKGKLGRMELRAEEMDTDEEDEEGGIIIRQRRHDVLEAIPVCPGAMVGATVVRGWPTWIK